MPNTQSMEERFDEKFPYAWIEWKEDGTSIEKMKQVKAFITSERELWKRESRLIEDNLDVVYLKAFKEGKEEMKREVVETLLSKSRVISDEIVIYQSDVLEVLNVGLVEVI